MIDSREKSGFDIRTDPWKGVNAMYPILALLGIMLLTWGAAVWATFREEKP
ncbi:MAG: hypothetical protein AB1555_01805 [Nitrospirota bacterium]